MLIIEFSVAKLKFVALKTDVAKKHFVQLLETIQSRIVIVRCRNIFYMLPVPNVLKNYRENSA